MYNLAKRTFVSKVGDTPDNVGPSTYYFDTYRTFKNNVAPFLSNTPRVTVAKKCEYGDTYYNVTLPQHIKGGSSVRNRAKREMDQIELGPGPADYDPEIPKRRPVPEPRPPGRGKLYLCTPPKGDLYSIPSIPTKIDENGYYIDENGDVIKNPPDVYDTTLGPAFYSVNKCFCSDQYKGCAWSKRLAKRETFTSNNNPGPGSYDIPDTIGQFNERDEYIREMARLFGFIPRYLEAVELQMLKEQRPGPGQYDINTSGVNLKKSLSIRPVPFICGEDRWKRTPSDNPPPGTYNIPSTLIKRPASMRATPFGNEASRFSSKITKSPGAADYNVIQGTIEEKFAKKRDYFGTVEPPFNSTAERKMGFAPSDSAFTPGAADYLIAALEVPKEDGASCCFRSKTGRFKPPQSKYEAGPASYNISEQFNKVRDKTSYNVANIPFQSTQSRLPSGKTADRPGPADYSNQRDLDGHGVSFGTSARFVYKYEDSPGPGSYTVAPVYGSAIYKGIGTHNLRLRESVLRKRLRLPPGKTWEAWFKELKKRRKLKCYKKESEQIDYVGLLFADV